MLDENRIYLVYIFDYLTNFNFRTFNFIGGNNGILLKIGYRMEIDIYEHLKVFGVNWGKSDRSFLS